MNPGNNLYAKYLWTSIGMKSLHREAYPLANKARLGLQIEILQQKIYYLTTKSANLPWITNLQYFVLETPRDQTT